AFEDAQRLVEEGATGFLFQPGDKQSLKQALIKTVENRDRLPTMGEAARTQIVAEHSWSNRVEYFLQEAQSILEAK
ncbi:MAG: glycosyltransferase, partial [Cyanobacteria bacterium P01_C01_bin.72]